MLKIIGKKIFTILRRIFLLILIIRTIYINSFCLFVLMLYVLVNNFSVMCQVTENLVLVRILE